MYVYMFYGLCKTSDKQYHTAVSIQYQFAEYIQLITDTNKTGKNIT